MLVLAGWFAHQQKPGIAANILLWALTTMLSVLAWHSGGVRDMAVLGYPGVLIFAAILGNVRLFSGLLLFIVGYCSLMAALTITGYFHPFLPDVEFKHLVFTDVILLITGFSVYLLLRDQRRLMRGLREENQRVRNSQQTIARLASQDQLTGLSNRRFAEESYTRLYQRCLRDEHPLAVFFLDLDNFKPVNDSLGHAAGDLLLQQLSGRLQAISRAEDVLCRFGGDEFLMMVALDGEEEQLTTIAQNIKAAATTPFFIMQTQIEISGSVGIALAPEHGTEFNTLCKYADLAMYQAKHEGRSVYRVYNDDMGRANIDKFNLMTQIRQALKDKQFRLFYQPKMDIRSGRVCGVEALIRWPQPDGSYIAPDDFIPLAESSGVIADIGHWVLQEACEACMRWRQQGHGSVGVAVNLSYVQFRDGSLERSVQQVLRQSGLPSSALELELTESMLIGEGDDISRQLSAIHQMGVSFSIDDFGTGYSNLGYLRRFNASRLKIDKSFITDLGVSQRDEPLVRAIIQMAASLGLHSVAEGVEDEATLNLLRQLGCDEAQGYFWSRALPEHEFIAWLKQHNAISELPHSSEL
ncbi:putative bifunctional diguanylate cyclase/phosphodiesterase [Thalassolituus pacificus]|uniref:cyclic-guanylate-specific phosphodiesterase n=1 Tax=Thalassolituus pacificus TaxID=2975440 RepID=A0A9X3AHG2_9GAMM|nr:EAL domain-containing protein [Thalassolituus pacificus]